MSKRDLAQEVEPQDTREEEQKLGVELKAALAKSEWYKTDEWQEFFAMLQGLYDINVEALQTPQLPVERTEFVRGRTDLLRFLLKLSDNNDSLIKGISDRFEQIESAKEETD